jgi:hypothetical protein
MGALLGAMNTSWWRSDSVLLAGRHNQGRPRLGKGRPQRTTRVTSRKETPAWGQDSEECRRVGRVAAGEYQCLRRATGC